MATPEAGVTLSAKELKVAEDNRKVRHEGIFTRSAGAIVGYVGRRGCLHRCG